MTIISAVICTHNRANILQSALESLSVQTLSPTDFEVIVVDNASIDQTARVIEGFRRTIPTLHYIREDRLGLSWARNAGAAAAASPYVAYLDDDARAEPQWLEKIVQAFEHVTPASAAVGGRVWLDWDGRVPSWLPRRYWSLYTYLDLGEEGHCLRSGEYLVGANVAFRRDVLLEIGGFDTRLGRQGTNLLSGEEAALLQRLQEAGRPIYYEPQAAVWHAVHDARRHRRWLWARLFWDGASQPLLERRVPRPRRFYAAQAYRDLRRTAFFLYQWVRALTQGNANQRQDSALALIQRLGRLRSHFLLAWGAIR